MNPRYEKLKALLRELFQLDQPDLDFGLYRIMHAKADEINRFLDNDLLPQVAAILGEYKSADKSELRQQLDEAIKQAEALGVDPDSVGKVKELRAKYESQSVDLEALENDVYDHLYSFFRRYYHEGDFIAKRVYKPGVYAIPYEGEEVKLHWANKDQYYIKTSEYLRDFAFRLRPDDKDNPMRVHFKLVDAAEGAHNNVKASNGDRVFVLADEHFIAEENGELFIRFEYRPATMDDWTEEAKANATAAARKKPPKQKDLIEIAERRILGATDAALKPWIEELARKHVKSDGETADYSRLLAHLRRYAARNTFDYFIHKDLGGFLRRELDFYIKNEVMHLDDIEHESVPRVEQYLSKIKVIRKIAGKIIDFLAQLEDFAKKLWLKKKFVTETSWIVRLDQVPEELHSEVAANEAQLEEWRELYDWKMGGMDGKKSEKNGEKGKSGETVELFEDDDGLIRLKEGVAAPASITIDTRHFSSDFTARLLASFDSLDEVTDGVLFHSENFQALSLMQQRYRGRVESIYIDPPYNTDSSSIAYKNNYKDSSWASLIHDRLVVGRTFLASESVNVIAIDDVEIAHLRLIVSEVFGHDKLLGVASIRSNPSGRSTPSGFAEAHEYAVFVGASPQSQVGRLPRSDKQIQRYSEEDDISKYEWVNFRKHGGREASREARPKMFYPIYASGSSVRLPEMEWNSATESWRVLEEAQSNETIVWPIGADGSDLRWKWGHESFLKERQHFISRPDQQGNVGVYMKSRMKDEGMLPTTWWDDRRYSATEYGTNALKHIFGRIADFSFPKATLLVSNCLRAAATSSEGIVLDYFAGSGTTGHAVINLNREDGGRREFILVEMGDYFDTVLVPRLKKVTFSPEWKDGKPKRLATQEEAERGPRVMQVVRLESYEDTLNNLEPRRTKVQEQTLYGSEAGGEDGFREQYLLRYMLDVETRGSASLLNIDGLKDPTSYTLKIKRPGSDETRETAIDLVGTFNWLIGLVVEHVAAPQTFSASFKRSPQGRLEIDGRLRTIPQRGPLPQREGDNVYWFRRVEGRTRDGRKTLVVWRKLTGDIEHDNLVLDHYLKEELQIGTPDFGFDLIYVNGDNNIENLKQPGETWQVRLIEEDFHRLMFDVEGV